MHYIIFTIYIYIKVKVKRSRYRPGVAQRVGRGIALLFHDRGTRRGWVVSSTPRQHFIPGKDPVPILQEAGWAPESVWTGEKSRPHRDSIPDSPVRRYTDWATRPTHTHTHTHTHPHTHTHTHTHIYIYILCARDKLTWVYCHLTTNKVAVTHFYDSTTEQCPPSFGYP